jgi:Na+/H+ antiporter NhaC
MKYLKLSILIIIVLWVFGFWYMLTSHSDDSWMKRLEEAEKQLKELELLNKNNALLIKSLKYVSLSLSLSLSHLVSLPL